MNAKEEARREARRHRATLDPRTLQRAGERVAERLVGLASGWPGPAMVYISVRRELPTEPTFRALWDARVLVAVPQVLGDTMVARRRDPQSPLTPGAFGVPTSDGEALEPVWVCCPGLAFDRQGGRLGYGAGFYDRYLTGRSAVRVGLCLDEALLEELPLDPHDQRMDIIVTPNITLDLRPAPVAGGLGEPTR
jgi:5-formyltetrahydrofolate cyclo-ligase